MKTIVKLGWVCGVTFLCSLGMLQASSIGCGNGQQGGPSDPNNGSGNNDTDGEPPAPDNTNDGDPVNIYSANEHRTVTDLTLFSGVGEHRLAFKRFTNSRFGNSDEPFGAGSTIRHSYQWDMVDYQAGELEITYPDGAQNVFTQVSSTQWNSTPGVSDILYQSGTTYTLQLKNGWQYHFATISPGSSHYYQMQNFTDNNQNNYVVSYNASNMVTQVAEPAGRYLHLDYGSINLISATQSTQRITSAQVPSTGQWATITLTRPFADRYLRFRAGAAACEIAELQFLDAYGNVISGTSFGTAATSSSNGVTSAFDGSPATYFESTSTSGGYVGIDQGTGTPVSASSVRILARSGYESNLNSGNLDGDNTAPSSVSAITSVQASDGRTVSYSYQQVTNSGDAGTGGIPYTYAVLSGVAYPDGTAAQYTYAQTAYDSRPLMTDTVDPRYPLPFTQIHTDYYPSILGAVQDQVDTNGQTMITLGAMSGDGHQPSATVPVSGGSATTHFTVNAGGTPTTKVDNLGRTTTFTSNNNAVGFLTAIADPLNHTTQISPSTFDNPLQITHPDGSVMSISRDSLDLPLTVTDERSNPTTLTRDSSHRITGIAYPDGTTESLVYNSFGQVTSHQLRNGATETSAYDGRGLLQSFTDAVGQTSTFTYDSLDRPASRTDANGHTTQYAYNDRGQITQITYADGSTYSYAYDAFGDKTSETNQIGQSWTYIYDNFKRVTSITDPLNRTTTYTFGGGYENKPIVVTLPSGKQTTYIYDAEWQVTSKTVGAGTSDAATTSYAYDNAGNLLAQTDPKGHLWTYTYDTRNRKLTQTDPLGHTTSYAYDAVGNVTKVTRPDGGVTTNTYDPLNRLLTTTDPKGETTTYNYDASGNMLTMTDTRGNTYSFTYNLKNRKTSMTYPDGSHESYGYDPVGNMVSYTTRAGQTKTSVFDSRNREVSYTWSDGVTPNVSRSYDAVGRLVSSGNGVSTSTYAYDAANEMLSETQTNAAAGVSWPVSYSYDTDGNRAGVTYPSGVAVTYGRTNRNQINAIAVGGTGLATYSYDGNGNTVSNGLSDGTLASYTYDAANRLTTLNHTLSGASFARFDYGYDTVNRRTYEKRDSANGDVYGYDAVDQVSSVNYDATNPSSGTSGTDRTVGYAYDTAGNRTAVNDSVNGNASYTANADNQYTSVGTSAYSYDGNGNLVGGNGVYTYDAQNRLNYAEQSSNIDQMTYDSKNRVVKRTVNGTVMYFIYDGWDMIEERGGSNNVLATYVHGVRQDEMLTRTASGTTIYYHHNANGNVANLTNASGAIVEKYKYDVFGKPAITDGAGNPLTATAYGNRFLFTGREYLAEVNLYDYRNRVYSADLGRFLQTDPIRFSAGDVNIYRYCRNNPGNSTDPYGLYTTTTTTVNPDGSTTTTLVTTNDDGSTSTTTETTTTSTSTSTNLSILDTTTTTSTTTTTTTTEPIPGGGTLTIGDPTPTTTTTTSDSYSPTAQTITDANDIMNSGNNTEDNGNLMKDGIDTAESDKDGTSANSETNSTPNPTSPQSTSNPDLPQPIPGSPTLRPAN